MAADVILPFNLIEDIDVLYSISLYDKTLCYSSPNKNNTIDLVINYLTSGKDSFNSLTLKEPCKNIKYSSTGIGEDERCEITFDYIGKNRKIIYYIDRNFYIEWPKEIKSINYLSSIGAAFGYLQPNLNKLLRTRCTDDCIYYENWEYAPESELIKPKYKIQNNYIYTYKLSSILSQKEYFYKPYKEGLVL